MKKPILLCIALLVGAFVSGCTDSAPSGPTPGLGGATVTKYVAIGNSLTAGYQSNGLYASAQIYSYPNMIAQQLVKSGAPLDTFQQCLWDDPGIPDPGPGSNAGKAQRYEIISFTDPNNPVIGPRGVAPGSPSNVRLQRPFDNLGIPGIPLVSGIVGVPSFLDTTNSVSNGLAKYILQYGFGKPFPKSVFKQIVMFKQLLKTPDLVTLWLGANDVLGFATSGGTGTSTSSPTPGSYFALLYNQVLDSLRNTLPSAKIVLATIPDVRSIPFFTTVNAKVMPKLAANNVDLYYQRHTDSTFGFGKTRLTGPMPPMITLKGSAAAALLGDTTGAFYAANGLPMPPDSIKKKPFGFHPYNPFPNSLILDSVEQVMAINAINQFNGTIASVASSHNAVVFDAYSFFNGVKANGYSIAGEKYTADYISGGLFSLDGVHPSSRGYAIVANQFIKTLNSSYGMSIPYVDVSTIPGIPMPLGKYAAGSKIAPSISLEAWKSFDALWGSGF